MFLAPLFGSVPDCATAPVLVLVGTLMMTQVKDINWHNFQIALPSFLTMVITCLMCVYVCVPF